MYIICVNALAQINSSTLITQIQSLINSQPDISRCQLARQVCEWLNWRSPNGELKEMSCRTALLKLHRQGRLKLPASKSYPNLTRSSSTDRAWFSEPQPLESSLSKLGYISLVPVEQGDRSQSKRWNAMMTRYHYLGAGPLCGAQIRYFIESEYYGTLGGLAFSAAAWHLAERDRWIGWDSSIRQQRLSHIVNNSRFLIVPQVKVKNLASHVLGLVSKQIISDWQTRYAVTPVLLETFVETGRFRGTSYRAANWIYLGQTKGRGRQDKDNKRTVAIKDVYVYPLCRDAVERLSAGSEKQTTVPNAPIDWAEEEFGAAQLGDDRRIKRLLTIARDFYACPQGSIAQSSGTHAKAKAAYRFFVQDAHTMDKILAPHYESTLKRSKQEKLVLAVQDTTSLNYSTHPATQELGPISTQKEGIIGLLVHDTMAFNEAGTPLGLLDVQCWARNPDTFGKRQNRHNLSIEEKESYKWLKSFQAVCKAQKQCSNTLFVSVSDRESDIYELFAMAQDDPDGPELLVRARHDRLLAEDQNQLWHVIQSQPVAGRQHVQVPRREKRKARVAKLDVRYAKVVLKPPQRNKSAKSLTVWAVLAQEIDPPDDVKEPLEWMLLTTIPVTCFEHACEKLTWYTRRWGIEVYHRTLKSGCKIEERQLGTADRIETCLAIDMVVAWRIYHLTKLGREVPDVPCTVYFQEPEWKALVTYSTQNPVLPEKPPTLREAIHMLAGLGGFLGRKSDGDPGTKSLWLGILRLDGMTEMYIILAPHLDLSKSSAPSVQNPKYG